MTLVSDAIKQMTTKTNKSLQDDLRALEQLTGKQFYYYLDDYQKIVYEEVNVLFKIYKNDLENITQYDILENIFTTFFKVNFNLDRQSRYKLGYVFDYPENPENIIITISQIFKYKPSSGVDYLKYSIPIPPYLLDSLPKIEKLLLSSTTDKPAPPEIHIKCYWKEFDKLRGVFTFLAEQA